MEAVISNPTFWVAVSFFIFIALVWSPLSKFITKALDTRSEDIAKELREAVALREEAQSLLAEYQKKQRENMEEAGRIVEQTKADAQAMAKRAEQDLRDTLEKRKILAMEKIAQAEANAIKSVQQNVVDLAILATQQVIDEDLEKSQVDAITTNALNDIEKQLA